MRRETFNDQVALVRKIGKGDMGHAVSIGRAGVADGVQDHTLNAAIFGKGAGNGGADGS